MILGAFGGWESLGGRFSYNNNTAVIEFCVRAFKDCANYIGTWF